jgi:hypothetical protein
MPKLSSISPADRSDDTPPAADSSTSTAKQHEPPHKRPNDNELVSFDAPTSPPHDPTATSTTFTDHSNALSGTHRFGELALLEKAPATRPSSPTPILIWSWSASPSSKGCSTSA